MIEITINIYLFIYNFCFHWQFSLIVIKFFKKIISTKIWSLLLFNLKKIFIESKEYAFIIYRGCKMILRKCMCLAISILILMGTIPAICQNSDIFVPSDQLPVREADVGLDEIIENMDPLEGSLSKTRAGWTIRTGDSTNSVGLYTSIAVASNGDKYISYYDSTNGNLKLALWNGASWTLFTLDSTGDVGKYTSIAIDEYDYIHISYYHKGNGNLRYAFYNGASWAYATKDSGGDVGLWTSIALDSNNYPHISYYDATNGYLRRAWEDGSGWNTETVDSSNDVGQWTSCTINQETGDKHISYYDYTNSALKRAFNTGSGWNTETVDNNEGDGECSSITLDNDGYPHISYYDCSNANLKYAEYS